MSGDFPLKAVENNETLIFISVYKCIFKYILFVQFCWNIKWNKKFLEYSNNWKTQSVEFYPCSETNAVNKYIILMYMCIMMVMKRIKWKWERSWNEWKLLEDERYNFDVVKKCIVERNVYMYIHIYFIYNVLFLDNFLSS